MPKVEGHCLCLPPNMGEQITSACTWNLGAQLKGKITGVLKALPQSGSWNWEASLGLCVGSTENAEAVGVIWATPHPSHCPNTHGSNGVVTAPLSDTCCALQNFSGASGLILHLTNPADLVSRVCISGSSGPCRCKKCW